MFSKKGAIKRLFLYPWMDGMQQGARDGGVAMSVGGMQQRARTAVSPYLYLFLLFIPFSTLLAAPSASPCSASLYDDGPSETATVRFIYDGDTLQLDDGRKIRLIGINTPEIAHKRRAAEPFAIEAKNALKALFKKDKHITLLHGPGPRDHYGRTLAHGFLADGLNIQTRLLDLGLASVITIPPNTRFAACYLEHEHEARCHRTGLWQDPGILAASGLNEKNIGFHLVQGRVKSITTNDKGIWLNIDDTLTLGIRPDNQPLFDIKNLYDMEHQRITVRGWINKSKKSRPYYIRVRHPASIQLSRPFNCS